MLAPARRGSTEAGGAWPAGPPGGYGHHRVSDMTLRALTDFCESFSNNHLFDAMPFQAFHQFLDGRIL